MTYLCGQGVLVLEGEYVTLSLSLSLSLKAVIYLYFSSLEIVESFWPCCETRICDECMHLLLGQK